MVFTLPARSKDLAPVCVCGISRFLALLNKRYAVVASHSPKKQGAIQVAKL
jgi:hypothetical protein